MLLQLIEFVVDETVIQELLELIAVGAGFHSVPSTSRTASSEYTRAEFNYNRRRNQK